MRLKQIKLAGFKSFVDPTTVTLPSNRCAVVGPNGCGKSNIIDAVRWVMGESSAKQLRGENLTDVIFSGSNSRKPTAIASIELVFSNEDGRIGGEYSAYAEISVRRQVTRESQSTYFLNGNKCRRRDIMDIFLGTGFGPRSYSIIEQGMISQLVEAKPEDLRVYLEEAAGISKYKERRRETENRVRHTRENLDRLNDIREELDRQLQHLKRQSRAAERYRGLKEEERKLTAELHTIRLLALEAELDSHREQIQQLEVELSRRQAEQQAIDTQIEQGRQAHADTSATVNQVQGTFYQLGADIARIEEAIQFNQQRVKQLELDLETVTQRSEETGRQLAMDDTQIRELRDQLAELEPRRREAERLDGLAAAHLAELEQRHRAWQDDWDDFRNRAARNERDAEVQASRVEHLEQLLQRLRGRHDQLLDDAEEVPAVASDDVASLADEIAGIESRRSGLEAETDRTIKALASLREDVLVRERMVEEARGELQSLRHDLASLQAVQRAALGRDERSAQEWVDARGLGSAERLGETLAVVPGWEHAVEAVLGDDLQGIRVDDVSPFGGSLENLPGAGVTLVEGSFHAESSGELPSLASLIRSGNLKLDSLLFGIFAAESVEVAFSHRGALRAGQSIITREGIWVGPDWVRILPASEQDSGIIQRTQELETLALRVEEAELGLAELQSQVLEGRAQAEALELERAKLQAEVNDLNVQLGDMKAQHGVKRVQIEEAGARRERIHREREELDAQVTEETRKLLEAREALATAERTREQQDVAREELESRGVASESELAAAREEARANRERYHALNAEWQSLESRMVASETARDRLVRQRRELDEQRDSLEAGIASSATPLPDLRQDLETRLSERLEVEQQLSAARSELELLAERIRGLETERGEAEAAVESVRSKLETTRVERQGLAVQQTNLTDQIASTGLDLADVRDGLAEDAEEARWVELLERTDRRIQRLGPINLAAIEEFEAQSERKVYLDKQNEDLEQALETLLGAIRRIDRETRARFKETFEAVNRHLGELFPKVFGGGHAYLELTGEDLLDTGVSLMARPPGKRNASVHLLSGGEKAMTAVALIFAIFHLNPSPVCMLDEVDAPLDDVNVLRFAELIKDMSADVQFVVITHNKLTMEMADHLMGVTMNEPGVSRLVSVDVEEASAMAG
ncbi:MAG: chromosome segregation protein SMC [Pseudomonadales bacterium]|nr:chromosome segregation protein SMC [Pseudomonadales bacterium]NIX08454.1 chromosome segregation protein SMC [Pseudomonadales bacterium]